MSYKLYDAEIEYLESTGTQYIDTGYTPVIGDSIYCEFMLVEPIKKDVFQSLYSAGIGNYQIIFLLGTDYYVNLAYVKHFVTGGASTLYFHPSVNTWYTLTVTSAGVSTVGNVTTTSSPAAEIDGNEKSLWLWERRNGTSPFGGRIRRFYIKNNGVMKLDLIPVRVGNVGYMYDKVSGQLFGNSGTGDFVLGPDVAPGRYANEIAFLESTGSQYIDTGVVTKDIRSFSCEFLIPRIKGNYSTLCGARDGNSDAGSFQIRYGASSKALLIGGDNNAHLFDNLSLNQKHKIELTYPFENITIDGETISIEHEAVTSEQVLTFWGFNNGTTISQCIVARIYSLKINDKDFIPVEYNNIGYLYDKVSGEFFANQGTGKFVLGHRAPRFDGKACARSYTRRQLLAEKNKRFSLLYHWEASDGIVNNQWIDRRKGYAFTKNGSPIVMTLSGYEVMRTNFDNYFKANLNSPALNMGSEWMIAIEFIISVFPTDKTTYLLDFGSLGNAAHAFGIYVNTNKMLGANVKLAGNSTTFSPPTTPVGFVEYKMSTIIFGAEPYDSTHNNIYTIAEGIKMSASSHPTIANCRFNGNFSSSNGFFGRGWDTNAAWQSKSYKYIKSIKIYKDNKKR